MYTLGIDIGGTKCAVVLGKDKMCDKVSDTVIDKVKFATEAKRGWKSITDDIIFAVEDLLTKHDIPNSEILGIGISCGGPLDSKKGLIMNPPNLPGWDNVPITEILSKHFGTKAVLQNDANACALAEWKYGAGKGMKNLMFLTFGTGMGAGLILNGELYSGTNDLAGEVGHIRLANDGPVGYGKAGSFEGFCSGGGIAELANLFLVKAKRDRTYSVLAAEKNNLTAKSVSDAAKMDDIVAQDVYTVSAYRLGQALSLFIDILNPEAIIIGSIYARDTELFEDIIKSVISKEALPLSAATCKILPSALNESIGDIAALSLVL